MTVIHLMTSDQELIAVQSPKLASGDVNTVQIKVDFDDHWNNFSKTATFIKEGASNGYEVVFVNDYATVPHEVLDEDGNIFIGVRGTNGANIKTSALVKYRVVKGAGSGEGSSTPTPTIYQQLLDTYASVESIAVDAKNTAINAQNIANNAKNTADNAKNTANNAKNTADNAQNTANNAVTKADNAQNTANNAMPKSGGTFTNDVTINGGSLNITSGQVRCTGSGRFGTGAYTDHLEIYRSTPYIDFHFGETLNLQEPNNSPDYTSRIIEDGSGHLTVQAGLNITGSFTNNSDRRIKENIVAMRDNQAMVLSMDSEPTDIYSELFDRLMPSQYTMKDGDGRIVFGLVAQDVVEAMAEIGIGEDELDLIHHRHWNDVDTGEAKELYSIGYINLISILIHEVQKLKNEVKALKATD